MSRILTAVAAALAVSACAPMSSSSPADRVAVADVGRACFLPQSVTNFAADDDTVVYVRASRDGVFEIRTGGCFGLDSTLSLAIGQPLGSSARACVGDRVELAIAGRSAGVRAPGPCRAEVTRRLSEADIAALPSRLRP